MNAGSRAVLESGEDEPPGSNPVPKASLRRLVAGRRGVIVFVLAAVLALDHADRGVVGAIAPALKHSFHVSNADIGILAGAFGGLSALATLPFGVLTDRVKRSTVLGVSIVVWGLAMALTGAAPSFTWLFVGHLFLGVVTAAAGPTVASLTGDFFGPERRARVLGLVNSGELIGAGVGFLLAGVVASFVSWRWAFWLLVPPAGVLAWIVLRAPEPERGEVVRSSLAGPSEADEHRTTPVRRAVETAEVEPNSAIVLDDPEALGFWSAIRYALRVPTNVIVVVADAVGNFFFAGLRIFALLFVIHQYDVSRSTAVLLVPVVGAGALFGMVGGGRVADHFVAEGVITSRLRVAGAGFVGAALLFLPAMLVRSAAAAVPLFTLGAAGLGATTPTLDAVRLDIIHPYVWGRAESIRTVIRGAVEALAPVVLGVLADHLAGGGHRGLQLALMLVLPALVLNGLILAVAVRHYAHDVASVHRSVGGPDDDVASADPVVTSPQR